MRKPQLCCSKCGSPYHYTVRQKSLWALLPFLPVRRFFCAKCLKVRSRWLTKKQFKQYEDPL